jgi:hypothetical protein
MAVGTRAATVTPSRSSWAALSGLLLRSASVDTPSARSIWAATV